VAWRELASLVAAGRILSTVAEALTLVDDSKKLSSISWVGNGSQYALWLGGNVCHLVSKLKPEDENAWGFAAFLLGRALSLGYTGTSSQITSQLIFNTDPLSDQLVRKIYSGLLIEPSIPDHFGMLLDHLRQSEQLAVVEAIFRDVQKKHFSEDLAGTITQPFTPDEIVKGVAALCAIIIGSRPFLKSQILDWLSKSQGGSIQTLGLRRALLATLATQEGKFDHYSRQSDTNVKKDALKSLLTRGLEQFGDKFHIKHVPIITQNGWLKSVILFHLHADKTQQTLN
jgi:telomere length regulation protein